MKQTTGTTFLFLRQPKTQMKPRELGQGQLSISKFIRELAEEKTPNKHVTKHLLVEITPNITLHHRDHRPHDN